MRKFTRNRLIYQTLKDFGFGLTLFIATISMATLDSRCAWPAPGTIAQNSTIARNAPSVDNLKAQHNIAAFIRESLRPEYAAMSEQSPGLLAERQLNRAESHLNMSTSMQFLSANALQYSLIAFLFASMFTLTFGFWRYLRREYASPRRTKWRRG